MFVNYRAGNRDSLLSTSKDSSYLSNKKIRFAELGMHWLFFFFFFLNSTKSAEAFLLPLARPLFLSFSRVLACPACGSRGLSLTVLSVGTHLAAYREYIGRERIGQYVELSSSVARIVNKNTKKMTTVET